jgi:hypothetical protein
MQTILLSSVVVSVVLLLGSGVFIARSQPGDKGLACLHETWMTAVMGVMLIALGFAICAMKWIDPTIAGEGTNSYWFVAGFNIVCQLLGIFALLFTWVKKVVAFDDTLLVISPFGAQKVISWNDVVKVEKPMTSRAVKLTDVRGSVVTVSGDAKPYARFLALAKKKVRPRQGQELLDQVEKRLRMGK